MTKRSVDTLKVLRADWGGGGLAPRPSESRLTHTGPDGPRHRLVRAPGSANLVVRIRAAVDSPLNAAFTLKQGALKKHPIHDYYYYNQNKKPTEEEEEEEPAGRAGLSSAE